MDVEGLTERLEVRLRAAARPERAAGEKRYLKSELEFFGAPMGQIRAAVGELVRTHPDLEHDDLIRLVEALWARPIHELRMASVILLDPFADRLGVEDLPRIERLVRESLTWALVDGLAGDVLGRLVGADPDGVAPVMDRWATDDDFWIRRASLLAELKPIRHGATIDRFLRRADPMLDEREFFIRKAIKRRHHARSGQVPGAGRGRSADDGLPREAPGLASTTSRGELSRVACWRPTPRGTCERRP